MVVETSWARQLDAWYWPVLIPSGRIWVLAPFHPSGPFWVWEWSFWESTERLPSPCYWSVSCWNVRGRN